MPNVSLKFPDGSVREYDAATTGAALAESISRSLAKKAVAYSLDGALRDLSDPLQKSGSVEIVTVGSRPGEKMFEELFYDPANAQQTRHPKILRALGRGEINDLPHALESLEQALAARDETAARAILFDFVAESAPQADISPAAPALAQTAQPASGA